MSIALDATSSGQTGPGSSSLTYAHTCTGANRVLFVGVNLSTDQTVNSVQYNSVGMTQILKQSGTGTFTYLFYLIAPSTGANNVVISLASTTIITSASASYTGAKQSAQPDASASAAASTVNVTPTSNRCWIIGVSGASIGLGVTYTAGSGFTKRQDINQGGSMICLEDSNGTVSAGSQAVAFSTSSGSPSTVIAASIGFEPTVFALTAVVGAFVLTGFAATLARILHLTATVGTYALTGRSATLTKMPNKWPFQPKSSSPSWSNTAKHSSSMTNTSKHSSTWSNTSKS